MPASHPAELIEQLRGITSPTVANAIELFNIRPRNLGFASGAIRCIFPDLPVMVGYACTATIKANTRPGVAGSRRRCHTTHASRRRRTGKESAAQTRRPPPVFPAAFVPRANNT